MELFLNFESITKRIAIDLVATLTIVGKKAMIGVMSIISVCALDVILQKLIVFSKIL